jgi:hypothetical protein
MKSSRRNRSNRHQQRPPKRNRRTGGQQGKPIAAYRQRGVGGTGASESFNAPEIWHEPADHDEIRYIVNPAGEGYVHPATVAEVRRRIAMLPSRWTQGLEVIQFSSMTRKRALFPCYGMQWGPTVYLYPIEKSLVETYIRPPTPDQIVEARMFGGVWTQQGNLWQLRWTRRTLKDFYLNNVLIHEIGHVNDQRNTSFDDRERFANWFAIEYGYRVSRGRR